MVTVGFEVLASKVVDLAGGFDRPLGPAAPEGTGSLIVSCTPVGGRELRRAWRTIGRVGRRVKDLGRSWPGARRDALRREAVRL